MAKPKIISLTYSSQDAFWHCPMKYYWSYEEQIATLVPAVYFVVGGAGHAGLASLLANNNVELAEKAVQNYFRGIRKYDPPWDPTRYCQMTRALIRAYSQQYSPVRLEEGEGPFSFELGEVDGHTLVIEGRFDAIQKKGRKRELIEHKFLESTLPDDEALLSMDRQVTTYIMGAREDRNWKLSGVTYNIIYKPNMSSRTKWTRRKDNESWEQYTNRIAEHILKYPGKYFDRIRMKRNSKDIQELKQHYFYTAHRILKCRRDKTWAKPSSIFRCRFCEFKPLCLGRKGASKKFRRKTALHEELE